MWIVYNPQTLCIYGKFYSKKTAKKHFGYGPGSKLPKDMAIDKFTPTRFDEWKMWATLQQRNK